MQQFLLPSSSKLIPEFIFFYLIKLNFFLVYFSWRITDYKHTRQFAIPEQPTAD